MFSPSPVCAPVASSCAYHHAGYERDSHDYYDDPPSPEYIIGIDMGLTFWNDPWWSISLPSHRYPYIWPNQDGDFDGDGLSNRSEIRLGTNMFDRDTDHDGLSDLVELWYRTNPRNPDTDFDGYLEGFDISPLWDSRNYRYFSHYYPQHFTWHYRSNNLGRPASLRETIRKSISKEGNQRYKGKKYKSNTGSIKKTEKKQKNIYKPRYIPKKRIQQNSPIKKKQAKNLKISQKKEKV